MNSVFHVFHLEISETKTKKNFKGLGNVMETNFFRNDDSPVFLIGHITEIFHSFSQNGLLSFVEKQTQKSYVVRLQRYWWISRSNFHADSSHPKNMCRVQWPHGATKYINHIAKFLITMATRSITEFWIRLQI